MNQFLIGTLLCLAAIGCTAAIIAQSPSSNVHVWATALNSLRGRLQ